MPLCKSICLLYKEGSDLFGRCPPAKTAFSGGFFAGGDEARSQPGKAKVLAVRTREASFAPQAQAPFISTITELSEPG